MTFKLIELTQFKKEEGWCWIAPLPEFLKIGDSADLELHSDLMLFENGEMLGPARAQHEVIRTAGKGAFSHWGAELRFSTSDNSSPTSNGCRYWVVAADLEETSEPMQGHRHRMPHGSLPVNYQPLDASPSAIERDAQHVMVCARSYVDCLPGGASYLAERSVLELGPGASFGTALALLCCGAGSVSVADRFLVPFDAAYHLPLYLRLRELLGQLDPSVSLDPLTEVIDCKQHKAAKLSTYAAPLESLSGVIETSFDLTVSNAVFEHLFNPRAAIVSLYALTNIGGLGLHQVDFRDHRDFSRPLEFLLDDERSFALLFEEKLGQLGGRIRPFQMEAMFWEAGFREVQFDQNLVAEDDYLQSLIARLRGSLASPFSGVDENNLSTLGGRFVIRK